MAMLIGKGTRKINLPHEEGAWIEVCDLTRKTISEAKRLKMVEMMKSLKDFGDIMEMFKGMTVNQDVAVTIESFDLDYVLEQGIVGWSYDEDCDANSIAMLDQKTAEFVANDLLGLEAEGDKVKG